MTVRTRFAPSPTGYLHIGGARTALFCWLYAKRMGGKFVLRIEDTDLERSTEESVQAILDGMAWLQLDADEGPFYQTKRFDRYGEVIKQLIERDKAYYCYCSKQELDALREQQMAAGEKPRYNRKCRGRSDLPPSDVQPVVRFKTPVDGSVSWDDAVRGPIQINNSELDDLIISRSDGSPTYNFTVVVDDMDMNITHVIRGDDHINNTPRQINIMQALSEDNEGDIPVYAHVPMILGNDGQRLSKRHGAVSVMAYKEQGILPEALRNYLLRLGWSHGDQELFSEQQMIELFDIKDVNRAAASFDPDKLAWFNQQYIKQSNTEGLAHLLSDALSRRNISTESGPSLDQVVEALRDRVQTIEDMADKCRNYYQDFDQFDESAAKKHLRPVVLPALETLADRFAELEKWEEGTLSETVSSVSETLEMKLGKIAQPLRVAITGVAASPPIDTTLALIGKDRTLARIAKAMTYIRNRSA